MFYKFRFIYWGKKSSIVKFIPERAVEKLWYAGKHITLTRDNLHSFAENTVHERVNIFLERMNTVLERVNIFLERMKTVLERVNIVHERMNTVLERVNIVLEMMNIVLGGDLFASFPRFFNS